MIPALTHCNRPAQQSVTSARKVTSLANLDVRQELIDGAEVMKSSVLVDGDGHCDGVEIETKESDDLRRSLKAITFHLGA